MVVIIFVANLVSSSAAGLPSDTDPQGPTNKRSRRRAEILPAFTTIAFGRGWRSINLDEDAAVL